MMITNATTPKSFALIASLALTVGAACGDDGGGASSKPPASEKKAHATKVKKGASKLSAVSAGYPKVSDELRRKLTEIDFVPDASGEINRDPFRSWVLKPQIETPSESEVEVIDVCTEGKVRWGAPNYSIRDLELIGLVKRGRSYAQFTDRSERDSWIVRKGDCIGQEKAIIEEVGVGFVRLSITPPAPPGSPTPPAQKQDISLHPDELEVVDTIVSDFAEPAESE